MLLFDGRLVDLDNRADHGRRGLRSHTPVTLRDVLHTPVVLRDVLHTPVTLRDVLHTLLGLMGLFGLLGLMGLFGLLGHTPVTLRDVLHTLVTLSDVLHNLVTLHFALRIDVLPPLRHVDIKLAVTVSNRNVVADVVLGSCHCRCHRELAVTVEDFDIAYIWVIGQFVQKCCSCLSCLALGPIANISFQ